MVARFDLPVVDNTSIEYWKAAKEREVILLRHCNSCGTNIFYPRPFCPACDSDDVRWQAASGRATLYTFSIVRHNDLPPFNGRTPYVAAVVRLEEGPHMVTNLVEVEFDQVRIGMPLSAQFMQIDEEFTLPVFRPAESE